LRVAVIEATNALATLFTHVNGAVRKAALDLACEIYRWMGGVFLEQVKSGGGIV
jgi:hypothetical protein